MKKLIFLFVTIGSIITGCDRCEREEFKPERFYTIEGKLLDPNTGEPLVGKVMYMDEYADAKPQYLEQNIARDTTDKSGNFQLKYSIKGFVFENIESNVFIETENLAHNDWFMWIKDTTDFNGEFCYPPVNKVKIKFVNVDFLSESDSIYIIFRNPSFANNNAELERFNFEFNNEKYWPSGIKLKKQELKSNTELEFIQYSAVYFVPDGFIENFVLFTCIGKKNLEEFYITNRYQDTTVNGVHSKQLFGCNEKVEFTIDIAKLEK